jgi:hypothetical protein
MVLTAYSALPGEPGFLATIPAQCEALSRVDASVGASGPHGFAVRFASAHALRGDQRPPHPAPRSWRSRAAPPDGTGWRKCVKVICPSVQGENFWRMFSGMRNAHFGAVSRCRLMRVEQTYISHGQFDFNPEQTPMGELLGNAARDSTNFDPKSPPCRFSAGKCRQPPLVCSVRQQR